MSSASKVVLRHQEHAKSRSRQEQARGKLVQEQGKLLPGNEMGRARAQPQSKSPQYEKRSDGPRRGTSSHASQHSTRAHQGQQGVIKGMVKVKQAAVVRAAVAPARAGVVRSTTRRGGGFELEKEDEKNQKKKATTYPPPIERPKMNNKNYSNNKSSGQVGSIDMTCWDLLKKGFCPRDRCKWNHVGVVPEVSREVAKRNKEAWERNRTSAQYPRKHWEIVDSNKNNQSSSTSSGAAYSTTRGGKDKGKDATKAKDSASCSGSSSTQKKNDGVVHQKSCPRTSTEINTKPEAQGLPGTRKKRSTGLVSGEVVERSSSTGASDEADLEKQLLIRERTNAAAMKQMEQISKKTQHQGKKRQLVVVEHQKQDVLNAVDDAIGAFNGEDIPMSHDEQSGGLFQELQDEDSFFQNDGQHQEQQPYSNCFDEIPGDSLSPPNINFFEQLGEAEHDEAEHDEARHLHGQDVVVGDNPMNTIYEDKCGAAPFIDHHAQEMDVIVVPDSDDEDDIKGNNCNDPFFSVNIPPSEMDGDVELSTVGGMSTIAGQSPSSRLQDGKGAKIVGDSRLQDTTTKNGKGGAKIVGGTTSITFAAPPTSNNKQETSERTAKGRDHTTTTGAGATSGKSYTFKQDLQGRGTTTPAPTSTGGTSARTGAATSAQNKVTSSTNINEKNEDKICQASSTVLPPPSVEKAGGHGKGAKDKSTQVVGRAKGLEMKMKGGTTNAATSTTTTSLNKSGMPMTARPAACNTTNKNFFSSAPATYNKNYTNKMNSAAPAGGGGKGGNYTSAPGPPGPYSYNNYQNSYHDNWSSSKGKGKWKPWRPVLGPNGEGADYPYCWDFVNTGTCKRGDRCKWLHEMPLMAI
ncbi:unnamed protein product [Amoebophrya sp. A25]|nr:unnamed protein product [Amoebophrya sp. A25]|eukprot:GSA25T00009214001.1